MHRHALTLAAVLGCALTITGCASATDPPSAAPTTPPADGGIADSPHQLITDGGILCGDLEDITPIGARSQSTCSGGNIVVRVYDDHQGVDAALEFARTTGGDLLTGVNWSILAEDEQVLTAAREKLGGELVHVPCAKPDCLLDPSPAA